MSFLFSSCNEYACTCKQLSLLLVFSFVSETFIEVPQIPTTSINVESKTVVITAKL